MTTPEASSRLAQLRAFATIERDAILEHMMRAGRDPAEVIADVPSVDEFVVHGLRDELLEDRGQLAEFSLARLASHSETPDAEIHRRNADTLEFALLREIADMMPELAPAVWLISGKLSV